MDINADEKRGIWAFPDHDDEGLLVGEPGSFEVFWDDADVSEHGGGARNYGPDGEPVPAGWYWWPCFPGCLPDGAPCGPFATSQAAYADAMEY